MMPHHNKVGGTRHRSRAEHAQHHHGRQRAGLGTLLGVMAFVGATHGLRPDGSNTAVRFIVGGMALLAVAFSVLALVLLSHASRESNVHTIERDWHRAHRCVIIAGVAFVLFAFGALWVAL